MVDLSKKLWKYPPCLMEKLTIDMGHFHPFSIAMLVITRGYLPVWAILVTYIFLSKETRYWLLQALAGTQHMRMVKTYKIFCIWVDEWMNINFPAILMWIKGNFPFAFDKQHSRIKHGNNQATFSTSVAGAIRLAKSSVSSRRQDMSTMSIFRLPSGKSPFLMGKSTISMAMFNSYVKLPEGIKIWDDMRLYAMIEMIWVV